MFTKTEDVYAVPTADIDGTGLVGTIRTSYQNLVERFGQPEVTGDYKFQRQWRVMTPAGVAAIYDWKIAGQVELNLQWNIGGHSADVVRWIESAVVSYA